MNKDQRDKKRDDLISKFRNGKERYLKSPLLRSVIKALMHNDDPIEILDGLISKIEYKDSKKSKHPIPRSKGGKKRKFDLEGLEVGDSILFECIYSREVQQSTTGVISAYRNRKANNAKHKKFSTRKVDGGIRIWRIK